MADEHPVAALYFDLLERWNQRDAGRMAALFADDGISIGFDGSTMRGPAEIAATLGTIFQHHATAAYVGKIKTLDRLDDRVVLIQAVAGMVPPGGADINPAVNAIQTLVAMVVGSAWRIHLFQNTPAAFHGRPEASEALTSELREALRAQKGVL